MNNGIVAGISLRSSRWLAVALLCAHGAAAAALVLLPIGSLVQMALVVPVASSAVFCVLKHALLRFPDSIVAFELREDGTCALTDRADRQWKGEVRGDSYVSLPFTVVRCRMPGRRLTRNIVIVPDAVDEEDYRRLRVALRWKVPAAGEGCAAP